MRFVTYDHRGTAGTGVLDGDDIVDLTRALAAAYQRKGRSRPLERAGWVAPPGDLGAFLAAGDEALDDLRVALDSQERSGEDRERGFRFTASEVRLRAPVRRPGKVACMWVNYLAHGKEVDVDTPKSDPVFFSKFSDVVIGPGDPIVLPAVSRQVDYEGELALVIGREGKNVPESRALEHVAGYTILNDVSARDFNLDRVVGAVVPYVIQKTFDTFCPMGPALVTPDEAGDPHDQSIRLWIDGELLQDGNSGQMVFEIPEILSYLSRVVTLRPGDVVSTGTPPGSGHWRKPPRYLQPGNRVKVEVGTLGTLENPVVAEESP